MAVKKEKVFTIGHSTRELKEFIELLKHYEVAHLVDVRSIPRSRHTPQFNRERLYKALKKVHIKYTFMKGLGGLRHPRSDSINTAWRNASFRGYADYMQTKEFEKNLHRLINYAKAKQTAIMCAEALPWRCHRSLIGDALLVNHIIVEDLFSKTVKKRHKRTPWAKVRKGVVTYPEAAK
jgi:uncharacterized protein (DUF488 family)